MLNYQRVEHPESLAESQATWHSQVSTHISSGGVASSTTGRLSSDLMTWGWCPGTVNNKNTL